MLGIFIQYLLNYIKFGSATDNRVYLRQQLLMIQAEIDYTVCLKGLKIFCKSTARQWVDIIGGEHRAEMSGVTKFSSHAELYKAI